MSDKLEDDIEELQKKDAERDKRDAYDAGYKAGSAKIRRAVCIISASVASAGITFLHWAAGWTIDKFSSIQAAWEAFVRNGGLGK